MTLTPQDQIELATLVNHSGYRVLIHCLRAREQDLLASMRGTVGTKDALQKLRFWQVFSQLLDALETDPASVAMAIDSVRQANDEEPITDYDDPIYQFAKRYVPPATIKTEADTTKF